MGRHGRSGGGKRTLTVAPAMALISALAACADGNHPAGPEAAPAIAGELEAAFDVFTTVAFREVGRGVIYESFLGGRGPEAIERNAGTVFRWDLADQRYEPSAEEGPPGGVRIVLYAALEAVPSGAPLVESGSIDYFSRPDGGVEGLLHTERGTTFELTFTGTTASPLVKHAWRIEGRSISAAGTATLTSTTDASPDLQGTLVQRESWVGPGSLEVEFTATTTHASVFGGEESDQRLVVDGGRARVVMEGHTLGGNGTHRVSIDGREIAEIRQLSELSPDFIEAILPIGEASLGEEQRAALRQIFRVRNHLATGVLRLVHPVLGD